MKPKHTLLAASALLVGLASTAWWLQRPQRTTEAFAGHLHHARYAEAARMLRAPSSLAVAPDGGLTFVDEAGQSTSVPAAQLPFAAGGREAREHACDFRMTALGPDTNGVLDRPAVTLHLAVDGGAVRIVGVDS